MDCHAITRLQWIEWEELDAQVTQDPKLNRIIQALQQNPSSVRPYNLSQGRLFHKGRIVLPANSPLIPRLLTEFHATPLGGDASAYRTYRRLAANVYWPGMIKMVQKFIAGCLVCQKNKYEAMVPASLLQPLPIPNVVWEDIAMDFITGLPCSHTIDCILVVTDCLSKYGHFLGLRHPYTALSVVEIFVREVVRLHGIPQTIVSDRDPLFLSNFWTELFRLLGTKLKMSSAYHPQTDGQTEVLNRGLETFL